MLEDGTTEQNLTVTHWLIFLDQTIMRHGLDPEESDKPTKKFSESEHILRPRVELAPLATQKVPVFPRIDWGPPKAIESPNLLQCYIDIRLYRQSSLGKLDIIYNSESQYDFFCRFLTPSSNKRTKLSCCCSYSIVVTSNSCWTLFGSKKYRAISRSCWNVGFRLKKQKFTHRHHLVIEKCHRLPKTTFYEVFHPLKWSYCKCCNMISQSRTHQHQLYDPNFDDLQSI